ncbi:hypothetical protein L208DRAFT_1389937, partial [Tricholoma matsutake]
MAPKSHSAKPASGSKAKLTSSQYPWTVHNANYFLFSAENNGLRRTLAMKEHPATITMIPHPEKGHTVQDLSAKAGLDCAVLWHCQPKELISKIIGAVCARQCHGYFKQFPHGWPIEEFLKLNLKNKCVYARKRGYLGDQTNRDKEEDNGGNDDDQGGNDNRAGDCGDYDRAGSYDGAGGNRAGVYDGAGDHDGAASGHDGASDHEDEGSADEEEGLEYY